MLLVLVVQLVFVDAQHATHTACFVCVFHTSVALCCGICRIFCRLHRRSYLARIYLAISLISSCVMPIEHAVSNYLQLRSQCLYPCSCQLKRGNPIDIKSVLVKPASCASFVISNSVITPLSRRTCLLALR
jgi:hypothetical protein